MSRKNDNHYVIDADTDDTFLDAQPLRYTGGLTFEEAAVRAGGDLSRLGELGKDTGGRKLKLPPPVDR